MATRRRRTAEEARAEILDAAERRLSAAGPDAIRLQDLAKDVGISHPAILHHFGSRELLVRAVVERAIESLERDLVAHLQSAAAAPDGTAMLDRVFETLVGRGHARLMAWLLLAGYDPLPSAATRTHWSMIAQVTHAIRKQRAAGKQAPSLEDTQFTIVLSALALFGQAIAGPATFGMAGLDGDPDVGRKFRAWLAALLARHLDA